MSHHVTNVTTLAINYFKSFFIKQKYYLSICCIVKDENDYLNEWLNYHLKIGVQHFFIYDNGSKIPVRDTVEQLNLIDKTTIIDFPGLSKQHDAYRHCLRKFGSLSQWIAFIDIDEFIVPKKKPNSLSAFLKNFEPYGGLGINWLMFGSKGLLKKSKDSQLKTFTFRAKNDFEVNRHIKSIVQPKYVRAVRDPHSFKYLKGKYCVNEKFRRIDGPFTDVSVDDIQINHYFSRSLEEYKAKITRGRADNSSIERSMEQFYNCDKLSNDIEDTTIISLIDNS